MTNKEAAKILKLYKQRLDESCSNLLDRDKEAFCLAIKALENARPTGKWIYDGVYRNFSIDGDIYHCSICKRRITTTLTRPTELFPFCRCGAKMKREAENEVD